MKNMESMKKHKMNAKGDADEGSSEERRDGYKLVSRRHKQRLVDSEKLRKILMVNY